MSILIYGGSFNPIHNGHISLLLSAMNQLSIKRTCLIPAGIPPHKSADELAGDEDRLEMCRLAIRDYAFADIEDCELKRRGKSYTYDTVCYLKQRYPKHHLYLLMGTDMFLSFQTWHRWHELGTMVTLVVGAREKQSKNELINAQRILAKQGIQSIILKHEAVEMSSTEIRLELKNNGISEKLPRSVNAYIQANGLYQADLESYLAWLRAFIRPLMTEKRYLHSLAVEKRAVELANHWGASPRKAAIAGILHDICKHMPAQEMLQKVLLSGIINNIDFHLQPQLLHGYAGALYVQEFLGIYDEDIIQAIRYHTTGRAGMSMLEKVVYLADLTSEDRNYPDVEVMRMLSKTDLNGAMVHALEYITGQLRRDGQPCCQDTQQAYRQYCVSGGKNEL